MLTIHDIGDLLQLVVGQKNRLPECVARMFFKQVNFFIIRFNEHPGERGIIIIIINFYSPVSNTRCHSIGHKMRIARIKIRVDSPGRWERA